MDLIGTELTVKKISEERDKKTKQVAKLLATVEHLKQSLTSSEDDGQVSTIVHNILHGAWFVVDLSMLHCLTGTLEHNSLIGRQACSNESRIRAHKKVSLARKDIILL